MSTINLTKVCQEGREQATDGRIQTMKKAALFDALEKCNGNRTHAAKYLGVSLRTVRNWIRDFGGTEEPNAIEPCYGVLLGRERFESEDLGNRSSGPLRFALSIRLEQDQSGRTLRAESHDAGNEMH